MSNQELLSKVDKLLINIQNNQIDEEKQTRLDKKFRLEFNYNSNHLEGNTLTYRETELLLLLNDTTGNHNFREYQEMKAHDVAFTLIKKWACDENYPLTEKDIKELNKIILVEPYRKEAITFDGQPTSKEIKVGDYKDSPNSVRLPNGEMHNYASPIDTPIKMKELIDWYNLELNKKTIHKVVLSALLHYKFIIIHPFDDANGRVARLIMNYVLIKSGYPPIVIKSADKKNYLHALNRADIGDVDFFVEYIIRQLLWSLELTNKVAEGGTEREPEDLDKKINILQRELSKIDSDKEIKKKFTKEVFFEMYESWILELLKSSIEIVQKFNPFFSGTNHHISISNGNGSISYSDESISTILEKFDSSLRNSERFSEYGCELRFDTYYGIFTKGGLNSFGCNYGFKIKFHDYKYEVLIDVFSKEDKRQTELYIEQLLHKPLLPYDTEKISSMLGDTVFNHIDYYSHQHGLR